MASYRLAPIERHQVNVSPLLMSSIEHPPLSLVRTNPFDERVVYPTRRRQKETVNEKVERILQAALYDAKEDALIKREGDAAMRERTLLRSHQLSSLYATSMNSKFIRSRARQIALMPLNRDERGWMRSRARSKYAIQKDGKSEENNDKATCIDPRVAASPIKTSLSLHSTSSVLKASKSRYVTNYANLKELIAPSTTLDAKRQRYDARRTAKFDGWESRQALKPLFVTSLHFSN